MHKLVLNYVERMTTSHKERVATKRLINRVLKDLKNSEKVVVDYSYLFHNFSDVGEDGFFLANKYLVARRIALSALDIMGDTICDDDYFVEQDLKYVVKKNEDKYKRALELYNNIYKNGAITECDIELQWFLDTIYIGGTCYYTVARTMMNKGDRL